MSYLESVTTFAFKVQSYDLVSESAKVEIDLENDLDLDLDRKYRVVACFEGLAEYFPDI